MIRAFRFLSTKHALKSIRERRLKISRLDELNDPYELLPYNMQDKAVRRKMKKLKDDLMTQYGLMCFSKNWEEPVVWAHYADKHRGMCLRFDLPDDRVIEIRYETSRLAFPQGTFDLHHLEEALRVKWIKWDYEQEVRLVVPLGREENDGRYYREFGNEIHFKEVIVGASSTVPLSELDAALGDLRSSIRIRKALPAFGSFRIRGNESGFKFHQERPISDNCNCASQRGH